MAPNVTQITDSEYELIKPKFQEKMTKLRDSQKKNHAWISFDKSKFLKTVINNEVYIVGAGNVFSKIIGEVLFTASRTYPEKFGKRNAFMIIDAIYDTEPFLKKEAFKDFLQNEQFALIFNIKNPNKVSDEVLRLDLFRHIKPEKDFPEYNEFIGGLFHALKHFNSDGYPLSTNKEKYSISHPSVIFELIIKGFFHTKHDFEAGKKGFTTISPFNEEKDIKCSYYKEPSGVYFLNTLYLKSRKIPRKEKKQDNRQPKKKKKSAVTKKALRILEYKELGLQIFKANY